MNDNPFPMFKLTRVDAGDEGDGSEPPWIVPVTQALWDSKLDRRGFLGAAVMAGAAMALAGPATVRAAASSRCEGVFAHGNSVIALALAADGKTLISGSHDHTIKLWRLPDGALLKTLAGHQDPVNALALTADGKTLISGSDDQTIRLWSLPDGEWISCLMDLECCDGVPGSVSTKPAGNRVCLAGRT
ncbi:hypothetical protein FACS1894158_18370 [Betaproteobacteria bacterium]|nr:hypothetical protein FACS1894158_18370 [Betaproteobacteria bacterium]